MHFFIYIHCPLNTLPLSLFAWTPFVVKNYHLSVEKTKQNKTRPLIILTLHRQFVHTYEKLQAPILNTKSLALWSTYLKVGLLHWMLPLKATWSVTLHWTSETACMVLLRANTYRILLSTAQPLLQTQTWSNLTAAEVVLVFEEDRDQLHLVLFTPPCCTCRDKMSHLFHSPLICRWV